MRKKAEVPETIPETKLKQDVETSQTKGETVLKQDVETETETENYLNPTTINELIHLRLSEGLSFRDIAQKTGVSLAMVGRILKGINTDSSEQEVSGDGGMDSQQLPIPITTPKESMLPNTNIPEPLDSTSVSIDKMRNYTSMKNKNDAIFDLLKDNKRLENQVKSLQSPIQQHRNHNGHDEPLSQRELLAYAQTQELIDKIGKKPNEGLTEEKIERIVERAVERHGKPDNIEKAAEVVAKVYQQASQQASSSSQGPNPYQIASNILALTKEQANLAKGSSNEFDLKKEEMRQLGELETLKLRWEMEKYEDGKKSAADTITAIKDIVKDVTAGPLGKIIGDLGQAGVDKVRGQGGRIQSEGVVCPNCSSKFSANPQMPAITCPFCGAQLAKRKPIEPTPPSTQQPQPQTEPTQTQEEPKSQEPKKPSIGTDIVEVKMT